MSLVGIGCASYFLDVMKCVECPATNFLPSGKTYWSIRARSRHVKTHNVLLKLHQNPKLHTGLNIFYELHLLSCTHHLRHSNLSLIVVCNLGMYLNFQCLYCHCLVIDFGAPNMVCVYINK